MKSCQVIPSHSFADPHTVVVVKHKSSSAGRVLPQRSVQALTVLDVVSQLSGPLCSRTWLDIALNAPANARVVRIKNE